ncbi:hypothetical protein J437_LFUL012766 [Ladona fulva]|uniref:Uncharacterized protein n=1 Tax=Ladona fulva TaxID=123851 RepID=A0A8K0PEH7_LADFU|nr:hypothetical protein J437_LFUL012766 [Ladona fulva]
MDILDGSSLQLFSQTSPFSRVLAVLDVDGTCHHRKSKISDQSKGHILLQVLSHHKDHSDVLFLCEVNLKQKHNVLLPNWYKKIGIHIFQVLLLNSYFLYNKYSRQKINLFDFRHEVIKYLLSVERRQPSAAQKVRRHFPQLTLISESGKKHRFQ